MYALTFNFNQTDSLLEATIHLDFSILPILLFSESGTYSQCTIVNGSQTIYFYNAVNQGVSGTAIGAGVQGQSTSGQLYASTLLTFQQLPIGVTSISVKRPLSAETLASARAGFEARSLDLPRSSGTN